MARKPGLTIDDHQQIGRELHRFAAWWTTTGVQVQNAYSVNSAQHPAVKRLAAALDQARYVLHDAVFRHCPDKATTKVYYPGADGD